MLAEHDDRSLWRHKVTDILRVRQTDLWERGHPIVLICSAKIAFLLSSQVLQLN